MNFKKIAIALVIISSLILLNGCKKNEKGEEKKYSGLKEKSSYIIGYDFGKNLKSDKVEIDSNILYKGLVDSLKGSKSKYSADETKKIMTDLQEMMLEKRKEAAEKNKKEGDQFLEKNKANPGIIVLPSGLQYKIISEGNGKMPKTNEAVKINLIGKLIDGTTFEDTYKSNKPITINLSNVFKGLQEAMPLMKTGSKWELYIPSILAYGEQDLGVIPANSTLIMEIELLSIEISKK